MPAPSGNIEETPPGDVTRAGRWSLTDGASDLAERGIEAVGAGSYLPSSLLPRPDEEGRRGRKRSRQARAVEEEPEVGWFLLRDTVSDIHTYGYSLYIGGPFMLPFD